MFGPPSPASSPSAHLCFKSRQPRQSPMRLYQPGQSSPLSPSSSPSSPAYNVQARRKRQYKSQGSSRASIPTPGLLSTFEDTPQKQFLRERFKAQCLERAKEGRARAVRKGRNDYKEGSSSDGFNMDGDISMDEADGDVLNDELYQRVMINEARRSLYSKRVSFERDFGSSIDPNMYEDMDTLEWELTGKSQKIRAPTPPSDDLEDELIQEYLAELESTNWEEAERNNMHSPIGTIDVNREDPSDLEREFTAGDTPEHPSPSHSMYSDLPMSSPPSSPSRSVTESGVSDPSYPYGSTWNCPFCHTPIPRSHIACVGCASRNTLDHAYSSWFDNDLHPDVQNSDHVPLATETPIESGVGVVMLCGAPGCDWCFAL